MAEVTKTHPDARELPLPTRGRMSRWHGALWFCRQKPLGAISAGIIVVVVLMAGFADSAARGVQHSHERQQCRLEEVHAPEGAGTRRGVIGI